MILSPDGNISSFDLGSAEVIESMIDAATKATKLKTNNALQKWREVSDLIIKPLTEEINQEFLKKKKRCFFVIENKIYK